MVYIQALSTNCILAPLTMIRARKIPLALSVIAFIWFVLLQTGSREELSSEDTFDLPGDEEEARTGVTIQKTTSRVAMICCGDRALDTLVALKSAIIFAQDGDLEAFIIADDICRPKLSSGLAYFKSITDRKGSRFKYKIIPHYHPEGTELWVVPKKWMCSTNRLFFPTILPETDAILYLDTDVLVISNLTQIWEGFEKEQREKPQIVASASEHVPKPGRFWYQKQYSIPYAGHSGLNSGVIFMNLTRMREFHFDKLALEAYDKYQGKLDGGPDQDILNIIFGMHSGNASIMDCNLNFNPDHCGNGNHKCTGSTPADGPICFCWHAVSDGVKIVHGYYQHFKRWGLPFMKHLYQAFAKIQLDSTDVLAVVRKLQEDFTKLRNQPFCFALTPYAMYGNAEEYLRKLSWSKPK